ncbi:MAG TPA: ABC transporter permease [Vicinamibacterales bacterium]|nr:ABC transporter permease [Vicinamibacterales bacterium]
MFLQHLRALWRRWRTRRSADTDLHRELDAYVELAAAEKIAGGVAASEARRQTLAELGGVESVKTAIRGQRAGARLEAAWADARQAIRGLWRRPAIGLTAAGVLGLVLGLTIAILSVVDATIVKPLPYADPDRLVFVQHQIKRGSTPGPGFLSMSWEELALWRQEPALFAGGEGYRRFGRIAWHESGREIGFGRFTAGLPALLGVRPVVGRSFSIDEGTAASPVAVIAETLWRREFGGRGDVLGSTISLGDARFRIIGVMPSEFRFGPAGNGLMEVWAPLPERVDPSIPGSEQTEAVFRLRDGLSADTAAARAKDAGARIAAAAPSPFVAAWEARLAPIDEYRSARRGDLRVQLLTFLVMTVGVLIIACANVANLLIVRGAERRAELALRTALGGSRQRLLQLMLFETGAIISASVMLALAAAAVLLRLLDAVMPPRVRQAMFEAGVPAIDGRVLLFAAIAAGTIVVVAGGWPALVSARAAIAAPVVGLTRDRRRTTAALLSVQVALALTMTIGAGLLSASFVRAITQDLGYAAEGLSWVRVELPPGRFPTIASRASVLDDVLSRVRSVNGVAGAAFGSPPPAVITSEILRPGDDTPVPAAMRMRVGRDYFRVAGMTIVAGREFGVEDTATSPPVAIVDERAAAVIAPDGNALGTQIRTATVSGSKAYTVIGVVNSALAADFNVQIDRPGVYLSLAQSLAGRPSVDLLIRTTGGGDIVGAAISAVKSVEASAVVSPPSDSAALLASVETFSRPRFHAALAGTLTSVAVALAAVAVYGLLAFGVNQRQREIALRMALGSSWQRIRAMVIREAATPVLVGVLGGWALAWLASRYVQSMLYAIDAQDVRVFGAAALIVLMAALAAALGPLRRAAAIDPVRALRQ